MKINAKKIGIILIALSVLLFLAFLSITQEIIRANAIECEQICEHQLGETCPHAKSIPLQSYVGFTLTFLLSGIGVLMVLSSGKFSEELTEKEKRLEKILPKLSKDEKKICELIRASEGAVFQSELVEKSGFSKAKVTRILDRLEGRGLIERRRRGMANLVILK